MHMKDGFSVLLGARRAPLQGVMMKKIVISLLLMTMLVGCEAVPQETVSTQGQETPAPTPSLTVDNAPEPTVTSTLVPTEIKPTRIPMPTITPTPTDILPLQKMLLTSYFDSPTPTFDSAQAVTVTPATAAVCPEVNPDVVFGEGIQWNSIDLRAEERLAYMLDYLNQGGSMEALLDYLEYEGGLPRGYSGDLNGDDVPELLMRFYGGDFLVALEFLGCVDGIYEKLYTVELNGMTRSDILLVEDMNLDGLPEVLIRIMPIMGMGYWAEYQILGWDGESFWSLISQTEFRYFSYFGSFMWDWIELDGTGDEGLSDWGYWKIEDVDQNGTLELLVSGGEAVHWDAARHGPYQYVTHVYTWNGEGFVLDDLQIGPPEYRFQPVHNGDWFTLLHKYDRAEESYRQAIDDPNLLWWTEESEAYINAQLDYQLNPDIISTPTLSAPDMDEYPNLAAYAQYRIVLLHALQGQMGEAEEAYEAMLAAYSAGEEGHIFVQLAERLLGEYRASEDVRAACAEVVAFAAQHEEEVLQYVGGYHGWQALEYEVEDVCPFK